MGIEGKIVEDIVKRFGDKVRAEVQRERRVKFYTDPINIKPLLYYLKEKGFIHLSSISCVDWIKKNQFELVYHLWSYEERVHLMVKTRISRENPEMETMTPVFPVAETYEREIHEMFGVNFPGNPNLKPLFLEDWDGPPPMRKDFDTRAYVREKYGMIDLTEILRQGMDKIKGVRDEDEIL